VRPIRGEWTTYETGEEDGEEGGIYELRNIAVCRTVLPYEYVIYRFRSFVSLKTAGIKWV